MKIDFQFESPYGTFCDAILLPEDRTLSAEEIEAIKQQRFDNWMAIILNSQQESTTGPQE